MSDAIEFRIATFNIRNGLAFDHRHSWPFRKRSTLDAIRDLRADIIGLQEVLWFQSRWLLRGMPSYDTHGCGRSRFRGGEASPVLVNGNALEVTSVRTRWFSPSPLHPGSRLPEASHPRIATTVTIRTSTGTDFDVTCLHLDQRSEQRRTTSTRMLLRWLDMSRPQIVLGDFNASSRARSLQPLLDDGFTSTRPVGSAGTFHRFTGSASGEAIDHILVSEQVRVLDATVVERSDLDPLPSDHWPVVATLQITSCR